MDSKEQVVKIQKTANTIYDLKDHTDVKYCSEITDFLIKKLGVNSDQRISTQNFSALVVSRYLTNHSVLESMASRYGSDLQIIELGSGFTPHFLNLRSEVGKYIEIDLDINSKLKEEITKKLTSKDNIIFISGDILSVDVWNKVKDIIDTTKPVIIFSEGVVAQYFTKEQKEKIANLTKDFLVSNGSAFIIDDTIRNHIELHSNPIIKEGMDRVATQSGNNTYKGEVTSLTHEIDNWSKLFNNKVSTIDYILSKPGMDFAINNLKLIVCMRDIKNEFETVLAQLSENNKNTRVWK